jgi:hypothetical protein
MVRRIAPLDEPIEVVGERQVLHGRGIVSQENGLEAGASHSLNEPG